MIAIKAFSGGNGATACDGIFPRYDYENDRMQIGYAHFKAVKLLVSKCKLDWDISKMNYGGVKGGYVFTFPSSVVS